MKNSQANNLVGEFGFYGPDPGNGLSPLQVLQHADNQLRIFAPIKLGGMELAMDPDDFMSIDDMEKTTLAVLYGGHAYKLRMMEDRIRAMVHMQRFLLSKLQATQAELDTAREMPVVVVEMDGGAIHCVRSSKPARVILLDDDTECSDQEKIMDILGDEKYVHDFTLSETATPINQEGIDPVYVEAVIEEIRDASTVK